MKKTIIALAAIMLGVIAQAATVKWTVDNTYKQGTTTAAEGWQIFLFDTAEVARDTFIASLTTGGYKDYVANFGGAASDLTDEDGYADGNSHKTTYGNPETVSAYFVLFDSDDYTTATFAYVSAAESATTGATAGQNAALNFGDVTATQAADNWKAVPEPTSGLLILIGMAGLALRRRRA